ncbi:hypothetical protein [Niabella hirudinis]|uniref:hypothetical protein n=1 Tax=Niabella hirudinis TaxID=1285929 RepID=UPI003EBA53D6
MKKNFLLFCWILAVGAFFSCRKNEGNSKIESKSGVGKVLIFANPKLANADDTLQALYKPDNENITYAYYGSYKNDGTPKQLKEIVVSRNDTAVKMFLDDKLRVKTVFFSVKGKLDTTVLFLRHTDTTTTVTAAAFYWDKNTHKIKASTVVRKDNDTVKNTMIYASLRKPGLHFGGMPRNICSISLPLLVLSFSSSSDDIFDYYKQIAVATAGVLVANASTIAANVAMGALLFNGPGAIVGGALGVYKAISSSAEQILNPAKIPVKAINSYEDDIVDLSHVALDDPGDDLAGSEIDNNSINFGTSDTGPLKNFTADCSGQANARLSDLTLEIEMNKAHTVVLNAKYHCKFHFGWGASASSNWGPYGGQQYSNVKYNENYITINWYGIWGGTDSFTGVINGRSITGTFYFNAGYGCQGGGDHITVISSPVVLDIMN